MINIDKIRNDFPILDGITYLDSASTSLTPIPVVEAIKDYFLNYNANVGRGSYKIAIKAGQMIDKTRQNIANFINSNENEVVFTKNTTEAINIVSNGLSFENNSNIIVSDIEHHSNIIPWLNLDNVDVNILKSENYQINIENLEETINKNTKLVAINHISNAFGSMENLKAIEKIVHDNGSYLVIDGAQSIGHSDINVNDINPDFMAFPGHKGLLGPVGTGFLYLKEEHFKDVKPKNLGGGTIVDYENGKFKLEEPPYRYEGGTLNIAGFIGLNKAISYIESIGLKNIIDYTDNLSKKLYKGLNEINNIVIYANPKNFHNIVSFNIEGLNPYDVSKILDETENISLRSGFHCAIPGLKRYDITEGTIRASIHCYNNKEDIDKLISALTEISNLLS
ncbi:MAG: cysteine desulfurase [Methanobrevibacter sp.]|jgi:cysteine desulfurase/selenocysteine lyase|nr:cysteine desulfurase [Methanobrevibacter sp.]